MEPDQEALEQKKSELRKLTLSCMPEDVLDKEAMVDKLFDSYVQHSPPLQAAPSVRVHLITMSPFGRGGGISRKPGNIYLNWRNLIQLITDIAITAHGVTTGRTWVLPFIALHVWNTLWSKARVDFDQKDAMTIHALWKNRNSENKITEAAGLEKTNASLHEMKMDQLSKSEYTKIINRFLDLDCIEIEDGIIWLRESVKITYN